MYLGTDAVQIDTYGCRLMGIDPADVLYIPLAQRWGAGSMEIGEKDIITLNQPQSSRKYPAATGLVRQLTKNVKQDSACYAALVRGLYTAGDNGIHYNGSIAIGQGFRGKEFEGLGIGNCCKGASYCVRGCPPTGRDVMEALDRLTQAMTRYMEQETAHPSV